MRHQIQPAEAQALITRCIASGLLSATTKPPGPRRPTKHPAPKPVIRHVPAAGPRRKPGQPTEFQRLALHYRVHQSTISKWLRNGALTQNPDGSWNLSRRPFGSPPKYDWTSVEWNLTNEQIAAALGCSPRTVSNMRPVVRALATKPKTA